MIDVSLRRIMASGVKALSPIALPPTIHLFIETLT